MKLLPSLVLTVLIFITSNAWAQELLYSTTKLELGGQNIEFSESLQSFVFAKKGQFHFYSIEDTSLLD